MPSADAFNMDQSEILSCGKELTFYHTIPTFKDPKEESFGKHCRKRRICCKLEFSQVSTAFATLLIKNKNEIGNSSIKERSLHFGNVKFYK